MAQTKRFLSQDEIQAVKMALELAVHQYDEDAASFEKTDAEGNLLCGMNGLAAGRLAKTFRQQGERAKRILDEIEDNEFEIAFVADRG